MLIGGARPSLAPPWRRPWVATSKKVLHPARRVGCPGAPSVYIPDEIKSFNALMDILNIASVFKHQNSKSNNSCSKGPDDRPAKT